MISLDEDALYCDLAEYYGLYDWKSIGLLNLSKLACGLRDESRIMQKLSGSKVKRDSIILAGILDRLSLLIYAQSKDARHNRNRPKSLVDVLTENKETQNQGFYTSEDYENKRKEIINGK